MKKKLNAIRLVALANGGYVIEHQEGLERGYAPKSSSFTHLWEVVNFIEKNIAQNKHTTD